MHHRNKIMRQKNESKYFNFNLLSFFLISCAILLLLADIQNWKIKPTAITTNGQMKMMGLGELMRYKLDLQDRTKLQEPAIGEGVYRMWRIEGKGQVRKSQDGNGGNFCVIVNALTAVTNNTNNQLKCIAIVTDHLDIHSNNMLKVNLKQLKIDFNQQIIQIDPCHSFLNFISHSCQKVVHLPSSIKITKQNIQAIFEIDLAPNTTFYSSVCSLPSGVGQSLGPLTQIVPSSDLSSRIFIFFTKNMNLFLAYNSAYYSRYSWEELVLMPILLTTTLKTSIQILYGCGAKLSAVKEVAYKVLKADKNNKSKQKYKQLCFVSYPINPYVISVEDATQYLQSILTNTQNTGTSIIMYLPYSKQNTIQLFQLSQKISKIKQKYTQIKIRIKLVPSHSFSTYAVYNSVYSFCPVNSMVVSSRHNVRFFNNFNKRLKESVIQSLHYYFVMYLQDGKQIGLASPPPDVNMTQREGIRKSKHFQNQMNSIQIFKSELMKSVVFQSLKSKQFQFYQTETAFLAFMMQLTKFAFQNIRQPLAKVNPRILSKQQIYEIKNIQKYSQYSKLPGNLLFPYLDDSLQNPSFRKNAPFLNTFVIHQVWVGHQPISPIRMHLFETIVKNNPNFQVKLWTNDNVTKQVAPLTYQLIQKASVISKQLKFSILALAADLLRYELLYKFGGIYIDFKFQGLKPLDQFLKYPIMFIDTDISDARIATPKAVGNGVMAATPNNYHIKIALNQRVNESIFQRLGDGIPELTGSFVLRKLFNNYQLFRTAGFGFQLVLPHPYDDIFNECGGYDKKFDPDQKVYEIVPTGQQDTRVVKMGIPCKDYPQAYLINYSPLSRTWFTKDVSRR